MFFTVPESNIKFCKIKSFDIVKSSCAENKRDHKAVAFSKKGFLCCNISTNSIKFFDKVSLFLIECSENKIIINANEMRSNFERVLF